MDTIPIIVSVVGAIVAISSVFIAHRNFGIAYRSFENSVRSFENSLRHKRADLLDKLFERFYEKDLYKKIRRTLDYGSVADHENLKRALADETADHQLCEGFVNYLNFFEYVASLWQLEQLSDREILMLFDYYLKLLRRIDFVWEFIRQNGFENLEKLLERPDFNPPPGG